MPYYIDELKPGMSARFEKTVSERDVELFGEVSGDMNPVHFDEDYARNTVFHGRIVHGVLCLSYISTVLGMESTSSRMGSLARQELYFKRFFSLDEMLERIERVTAAEVQALAQQFFDPKHMAVAMLGRLEGFRVRREDLTRSS